MSGETPDEKKDYESNVILSEKNDEIAPKGVIKNHPLLAENFQTWQNGESLLRTVTMKNEPFFVAKDVATFLGYEKTTDMTKYLDADEIQSATIPTSGGPQESLIISESGLYHAVFMSKKDTAKRFRKWVTSEVLPQIRRTGGYSPQNLDAELESERKLAEIARVKAGRLLIERTGDLLDQKLISRQTVESLITASGENPPSAFTDEDMRVKTFVFEKCRVVDFGFTLISELYKSYEEWCAGTPHLSRNTFVRRVQKVMGKLVDYKMKKINGYPEAVMTGLELKQEGED